jgi:hypothetical protein
MKKESGQGSNVMQAGRGGKDGGSGHGWPRTLKSFERHPVHCIRDSLYRIYRVASE